MDYLTFLTGLSAGRISTEEDSVRNIGPDRCWLGPGIYSFNPPRPLHQIGAENAEPLRLEALGKSFGDRWAFRDVNVSVRRGEVLTIMGPTGAGKTALLQCIGQIMEPTRDRLRGKDRQWPPGERLFDPKLV